MKISIVAYQLPLREGTAPGRALLALCEGLLADGHQIDVWSWWPRRPQEPLPDWCRWEPLPPEPGWRTRARALRMPRSDVARAGWSPAPDAIALADDVPSFAAVERSPRSVVTLHYLTKLEVGALGRRELRDVQSRRADRRVARAAALTTGYSERVARLSGVEAVTVPIAYPIPEGRLRPVEEPVAAMLANWEWHPNRFALRHLLRCWPEVRSRVPHARLLLAGRGLEHVRVAPGDGVEAIGPVARSVDLLERASVIAFPCPDTSGPKVKVIEALAYGIPVVTTPPGVEGVGINAGEGAVVAPLRFFGRALAGVLADPERRAALGREGADAVAATHGPAPAARARVAAFRAAFG